MSKKKINQELQFEIVPNDENTVVLRSISNRPIPKIILHCFDPHDLEKLNSIGMRISEQYQKESNNHFSKRMIAIKDFLMG